MSCPICGRSACIQSFHSLEEQDLHEQREAMPDDVALLRRMVQEGALEILALKSSLKNAARALDNAGRELEAQSAYDAANP